MSYTCFSGGANGSDFVFETESNKRGFSVVSYSFKEHNTKSRFRVDLTDAQLKEGYEHIKIANKRLNRNISNIEPYIRKLISRDWFQVKSSDAIFAIGTIISDNVLGGTGWACACCIDNKKPLYVFDQTSNYWSYYDYEDDRFQVYEGVPILTEKFAGIGTRNLNNDGVRAIVSLFQNI